MVAKITTFLMTISLYSLLNISHASDSNAETSDIHKRKYVVPNSQQPVESYSPTVSNTSDLSIEASDIYKRRHIVSSSSLSAVEPDQPANSSAIYMLSPELMVNVLAELPIYDIINCSRVSIVWHKAYQLLLDSTKIPMFGRYSFEKSGENYKIPNIDDREFFLNLMLNLNSLTETQAIPESIDAHEEYYSIEEKEYYDEHKNFSSQDELERKYKFFSYKDVLKNLEDTIFAPQPQPFILQGVEQHYAVLRQWYHRMPANHKAITNINLGHMYEYGRGVKTCHYTAFDYYTKARPMYQQLVQDYLAPDEYLKGMGAIRSGDENMNKDCDEAASYDAIEAEDYFQQAIEKDYLEAYYQLGLLYTSCIFMEGEDHEAEGVELLKQAAKRGHAGAQCSLSWIYTHGMDVETSTQGRWVLAPDYPQALEYCQQAVAQNCAGGYYHLGYLHNFGKGVKQDYQQARLCYQKAADQGHEHAQYRLGVLFEKGLGVEPDARLAFKYYQQSALMNYDRALLALARMCEEGEGIEQDYSQAFYWYKKLASQHRWYGYRKEASSDYWQSHSHAHY